MHIAKLAMKINKFSVIPLLLLSGLAGFFIFRKVAVTPSASFTPTPTPLDSITPLPAAVFVNIAYSTDKTSHYSENYMASTSALTILESVATQSGIPVKLKKFSFGTMVESINNEANTKDKAWIYFVNDQSASVSADSYIVRPGDKIDWKYIKPSF